jgi:basic amino acid/polyamine antiporter, APA family
VFNIPAVVVVLLSMVLLLRGATESARANTIMVLLKIGILAFFCVVAITAFDGSNFTPFLPFGFAGVTAAAGQVFFSYIGFDAASTAGEEAKNPRRDLPIAIIGSLIIVTVIYLAVAVCAIGARPWEDFEGAGAEAVLAGIARDVTGSSWAPALIALGAVVSIFSVVLVVMYGQTRILFAMGRDGLLPKAFTRVNPRTQTPVTNTIIVTAVIAVLAAFIPLGQLAEATSIGTLIAFAIVNVGVIALRRTSPDLPRSFHVPLFPITPILGVIFCLILVAGLRPITWLVFGAWLVVGLFIYFFYSFRRSALNAPGEPVQEPFERP